MEKVSIRQPSRSIPVPPPFLLRGADETFLGSSVLEEFGEPLAAVLWRSLRSARVWAAADAAERDRLFLPAAAAEQLVALRAERAEIAPALWAPLRALARVLRRSSDVTAAAVAEACVQIAEWADEHGKLATALAFMQTAALALPSDAWLAYRVGRLARRKAEYGRAEAWFLRAIQLARLSHDRESYGLTLSGFGNLHLQRGNVPAARRLHARALRAAQKYGFRELEGMAAHDLFVIARRADLVEEAEWYAAVALRGYGAAHPRLPNLAHDVALWCAEQGRFAEALRVFEAVLPHITTLHERLLTLGSIARAAGAVGDSHGFQRAWRELQSLAKQTRSTQGVAFALLGAAAGARSLRNHRVATQAASWAAEVAAERQENRERLLAEAILESLQRGTAERAESEASARVPSGSPHLADALVGSLERHAVALV